jgi:asparagine synthetase B (glutamine-hydrolysing)
MRRLSIIDLDCGHQPLCNEDEMVWIVFNGGIYNFPVLREQPDRLSIPGSQADLKSL